MVWIDIYVEAGGQHQLSASYADLIVKTLLLLKLKLTISARLAGQQVPGTSCRLTIAGITNACYQPGSGGTHP